MRSRFEVSRTAYTIWVAKMNDDLIIDVNCLAHVYAGGIRVDICRKEFKVRRRVNDSRFSAQTVPARALS